MEPNTQSSQGHLPWKVILLTTFESLLAFYVATFCMAMFFTHRGDNWVLSAIFLSILYAFVVVVCASRIIKKLSMAMVMLIIPIAPLIALIIVVTLIPILQLFP